MYVSASGYPAKQGKLGPEMSIKFSFESLGIVLHQDDH